jgi:hypothetical protein
MAYVPRYIYDVFISYAHLDERTADNSAGWVSTFSSELDIALSRELGEAATIWFDRQRLKPGFQLSDKIRYDLSRTAVLLRLESPSFWQSGYCELESTWFTTPSEPLDPLVIERRQRLLRAEILPVPSVRRGDELVANFHIDGKRVTPEAGAQTLAVEIATLLRTMESSREPIYIPRVAVQDAECDETWRNTVAELKVLNYRFTPRTYASETDSDLRDSIERSRLVVMLVGTGAFRRDVRKRVEMALEYQRRTIVWISPRAGDETDAAQGDLLRWLREHAGRYELLDGATASMRHLKERVRDALNPCAVPMMSALRAVAEERPSNSAAKIYLICDPRDRKKGAWKLKEAVEKEGFEVLLPEIAAPDARTAKLEHLRKLRHADGVLLYYHAATSKWFEQHWRELSDDTLPWRSRGACLVQPPDKQKWLDEARSRGYAANVSGKMLVTSDTATALSGFLAATKSLKETAR